MSTHILNWSVALYSPPSHTTHSRRCTISILLLTGLLHVTPSSIIHKANGISLLLRHVVSLHLGHVIHILLRRLIMHGARIGSSSRRKHKSIGLTRELHHLDWLKYLPLSIRSWHSHVENLLLRRFRILLLLLLLLIDNSIVVWHRIHVRLSLRYLMLQIMVMGIMVLVRLVMVQLLRLVGSIHIDMATSASYPTTQRSFLTRLKRRSGLKGVARGIELVY
mmetsp:Transcript_17258/g.26032  ORF Transcript_17258/g.26032 Transcript_17258/m.26032 type:complete len:221 (+) Transcript_17258:1752-2414(+)